MILDFLFEDSICLKILGFDRLLDLILVSVLIRRNSNGMYVGMEGLGKARWGAGRAGGGGGVAELLGWIWGRWRGKKWSERAVLKPRRHACFFLISSGYVCVLVRAWRARICTCVFCVCAYTGLYLCLQNPFIVFS